MATAARGHGLMTRVQQLETEVPSIERAFLSQTDHSSFFTHPGVDWHPNLRIDQNLVTQGDLPRFIMDSYEECRAPPRLFLLDKFDVGGAGACLKRYTDPSFFKVENSGMTKADVPREKKIRKAKKKRPRWKNGETTEVLPTSHTKLHQLFLEERIEKGVSNPTRRAKLKRRLNGFPFNSKTGKSYMEKLLKYPSPDNKVVHEVTTVKSSSLMLATFDHNESGLEVAEVRPVSPDRENVRRKRSPPSPDREETMLNSSIYESSEVAIDDKIREVPNLYPSIATDGEKVIAVDAESHNREGTLTGYQSDDIVSEVDNYVDATSTVESDTDADSRLRVKSDFTSSHIKNESLISDANDENLLIRSFDSQSAGDSTISDDGNNSSRKEVSSFSSDSPSTSAENSQSERISAKGFSSGYIPEVDETVDASSYVKTADEDFRVDQNSKPVVSDDDTCPNTDAITNNNSDYEQVPSSHPDSGVVGKGMLEGPKSDKTEFTLDDEEKKSNLVMEPPWSPCVFDSDLQSGDESHRSSAGEHLVDEPNGGSIPCISAAPYIHSHTADSSDKVTSDLLHGDESDQEDRDSVENIAFKINNVNSQNANGTPNEMPSSENLILGELDNEFQNLPNDFPSDYPDIVHNGDDIKSTVSKEENLINRLDNEDSGVSTDSPSQFPCFMETFLKKKLEETLSADAQTIDAEDNHSNSSINNQICSENSVYSHLANSSDWPQAGLDPHEGDVIPDEDTTVNETCALGTPKSCDVLGLVDAGVTHHVAPNDSEAQESSCCTPEDLKEPAGTSDTVEMDKIILSTSFTGHEVTENSGSADLISLNEVHILLDESGSGADKLNAADMASAMPALTDNVIIDDIPSQIGPNKLVEEHIHFFEDSGLDEVENDKNSLSGSHLESSLAEKVDQTKVATSGFETVLFDTSHDDHPKSEVSGTVPNSHVDLEADQGLELVHPETTQPPVEQSLLNGEQEIFQQSGLGNHVYDASSLPVDYEAEESIVQEEIGLHRSQLDQELLHSREISSEVSSVLPRNDQQMLYHDDRKGFPLDSVLPPSNPFSETNQINLADLPPLPPLPPVQWMMMGKLQLGLSSTEGETMKHDELFPQLISQPIVSTDDASSSSCPLTASTNDVRSSLEEMKHSLIQTANEPASKEEKAESENKQQQFVMPTSESEFTSQAEEDGVVNGNRTVKLPRPRHPLIDEFAALDKSKLRKVTERVRPQVETVDERDSLLEQIRTKSFNLRPALTSRPSIRGPSTNLKVAAIVEKANAIRQALAGSDEDDDDSWSDS